MKRPSFQFYPGDWLRDTALRSCSIEARGLWIDMLCFMHEGTPYGHLKVNSKVIDKCHLARMVGGDTDRVTFLLSELEAAGVFSRNEDGSIFSRRMLKDESIRNTCAAGGKLGGNPRLIGGYNEPGFVYAMARNDGSIKIGISKTPRKRLYRVNQQFSGDKIRLLGQCHVPDMGAEEARIHSLYSHKRQGEWFALSDDERTELLTRHLKVTPKVTPKVTLEEEEEEEYLSLDNNPAISKISLDREVSDSPCESDGPPLQKASQKKKKEPSPKKQPPMDEDCDSPNITCPQDLIDIWNRSLGKTLGKVLKVTDGRARKIRMRIQEQPLKTYWSEVCEKINESEWLMGNNPKSEGWKAGIDWLISNDSNHVRIMEGQYNQNGHPVSGRDYPKGLDALKQLRKEEGRE